MKTCLIPIVFGLCLAAGLVGPAVQAFQIVGDDAPLLVAGLEGRPAAGARSPLQALVDAALPGDRIEVPAGRYEGDLYIDKPVHLIGVGRPLLAGSGTGSVVRIRASHVTVEGFDIDGRLGGSLARDSSGIHVAAAHAIVRDCRIVRSLFGVYLREANDALVENTTVTGIEGKAPGEQGSGIHVWNTERFTLRGNVIRFSRDGFYIQSANHGLVSGNRVSDVRYGLHYMTSDDNTFEDNVFERGAAGAALMYSRRLTFSRNRFLHNRGFASVGLLLKDCEDVTATDNLLADNERGFFIDGAIRHVFRHNIVSSSDVAVVVYASSQGNRFEGNAFIGNLAPLRLVGRRTDTVFDGNYWSDHDEPDLDGDGVRDAPYRLSNVFDHLRGNLTAADLYAQGLGAAILARAERTFPVLRATTVVDARPLVRAPARGAIPPMLDETTRGTTAGLALAGFGLVCGALVLRAGRRPGRVGEHA
ncbi:MAG: nitrous oxide reductase family maturation protein NosD [Acidobacteria bacterium]|nr:nitrous oxide reductase family maturation protein NosD [Acidobacteriota bacterium]